ncbi:MAG: hypothetical protein P8Z37_18980 [Acidobacteriota bacterium]|jgi:hypothetical protein
MKVIKLLALCTTLFLVTTTIWADTIPGRWELVESLKVDTQINVRTLSGVVHSGPFQKLATEYLLILNESGSELRIPKSDIQEIARIQEGKKKRFWTGTKVGAILGFGSGLIGGLAAGDDGVFDDSTAGFNGLVLGGIGAGAGAIIGYAVDHVGASSEILYTALKEK